MRESVVTVYTEHQQITEFCKFAERYQNDFETPALRHFLNDPLCDTFDFVVSKYHLEEGEQIYRPKYYNELGGDCDDGTIFWIALLLCAGFPKEKIYVCEAKDDDVDYFTHIFCAFVHKGKMVYLDNLPGSKFGVIPYTKNNYRITPLTDFI